MYQNADPARSGCQVSASIGEISSNLDGGGDDECRAGDAEDEAGDESGEMRILPDAEDCERPIDRDRDQ